MENKITEGSKLIAEYLGWKYAPSNELGDFPKAGWWEYFPRKTYLYKNGMTRVGEGTGNFICRSHKELRFYNSLDALLPAIKKIEKETDIRFTIWTDECCSILKSEYSEIIGNSFDELDTVKNVFECIVQTIKYIQNGHTL